MLILTSEQSLLTIEKEVLLTLENLILTFGYFAIFVFMITNGIVSLPSSQFIYVTAGFFVPTGDLAFFPIVIFGTIGNFVGNVILYELSYRRGLKYISSFRGFSEERILKLERAFERRGLVIIFLGKFLPGVKVFVPVVAGIARMNRIVYAVIIVVTSFLWAVGLTYFGVMFGKNFETGTFGWYSIALILLSILAIYIFHKYVESVSLLKES